MTDYHLPDEVIETARQLFHQVEGYQWRVGDFLVDIVDEIEKYSGSRSRVIRELSIRCGADASTLRDRENMARFFPAPLRQDYEALSYSQLRACKAAGSDRWREYADWALGNLPAPVAMIRARIRNNGHDQPAWISRWQRLLVLALVIRDDKEATATVRELCGGLLEMVSMEWVKDQLS